MNQKIFLKGTFLLANSLLNRGLRTQYIFPYFRGMIV